MIVSFILTLTALFVNTKMLQLNKKIEIIVGTVHNIRNNLKYRKRSVMWVSKVLSQYYKSTIVRVYTISEN